MNIILSFLWLLTAMIPSPLADSTVLQYVVREPKIKSENPPLLVLLHGVGSNEEDLFSFANQLPDKYLVVSARAPIHLGGNSFAWYQVDFSQGKPMINVDQEEKSRNILIAFIEQLKEKYAVDANEIYLCGFSQGAVMSYSVALTRPDLVKGIAVMSGRLLEEIKPKIVPQKKLESLKVYISHGRNDKLLPIHYAEEADAYLKTLNIQPTIKGYAAGHEINGDMLKDLILWLR